MFFQLFIAVACTLVNGYCVVAFFVEEELRSLDYSLVVIQSTFDFIFSGLVTGCFYGFEMYIDYQEFCYEARGGDNEYLRPDELSIPGSVTCSTEF